MKNQATCMSMHQGHIDSIIGTRKKHPHRDAFYTRQGCPQLC